MVGGDDWTIHSHPVADATVKILENYEWMREERASAMAEARAAREAADIQEEEREQEAAYRRAERQQQLGASASTLPRGGAKRRAPDLTDPRSVMIVWAQDKAERETDFVPATIAMLLKAEFRTVKAVLSCKSQRQTHEVIAAAMKRAGLQPKKHKGRESKAEESEKGDTSDSPEPEQAPPTPPVTSEQPILPSMNLQDQLNTLTFLLGNQVQLMDQWMQHSSQSSQTSEYMSMLNVLQLHNKAQEEAIRSLASAIQKTEERISHWETTILPHIIDRIEDIQPHPVSPASSASQPEELMVPYAKEPVMLDETQSVLQALVPLPGLPEPDKSDPPILKALEEKSLRSQSAKVVVQAKGRALAPFKSSK